MQFWDFIHYNLGMHVYEFLSILTAAIMAVVGVVHGVKQKQREKEFTKEECKKREE